MSFLPGRLASMEGAYFLQESKQAVARLVQNQKNTANSVVKQITESNNEVPSPDVLPEVLRHSLPPKIFHSPPENLGSSYSGASKWAMKSDPNGQGRLGMSADAINPLRGYVSLPQVTFGPKRWQLPESENSILASTANDLRQDKHVPINPEKLKAAAAGLSQIGSAFAVATALVFGGVTVILGLVVSKLEVHNTDDIRVKGKDLVQPRLESFKERLVPLRTWADDVSKKWHMKREESLKEKPLIKELSRTLRAKTSP